MRPTLYKFVYALPLMLSACQPADQQVGAFPTDASAMQGKGNVLSIARSAKEAGDADSAAALLSQAMRSGQGNAAIALELATIYRQLSRPKQAVETLQQAQAMEPENAEVATALGKALIASGEATKAIPILKQALNHGAGFAAHGALGVAYDMSGEYATAQEHYTQALAANPGHVATRNNLALSYILNDQPDQALPLLVTLHSAGEGGDTVRQNLALAYGLLGQSSSALALGLKDLSPEEARDNLAFYQYYRDKRGEALPEMARVTTSNPPPATLNAEPEVVEVAVEMQEDNAAPASQPHAKAESDAGNFRNAKGEILHVLDDEPATPPMAIAEQTILQTETPLSTLSPTSGEGAQPTANQSYPLLEALTSEEINALEEKNNRELMLDD